MSNVDPDVRKGLAPPHARSPQFQNDGKATVKNKDENVSLFVARALFVEDLEHHLYLTNIILHSLDAEWKESPSRRILPYGRLELKSLVHLEIR